MNELKIPDDLNTRYKLAKAQLAILPSIDDDLDNLFLGTRYQCEEVIQLIERIAALEAVRNNLRQAAIDLAAKADEERNGRIKAEAENAQLRLQIAALKAPVSNEEWLGLTQMGRADKDTLCRRDLDALIAARAKETL